MTDSSPHQAQRTAPVPPPRRGFLLRLAVAASAPAVVLGLAGAWLARSLVTRAGEPLPVADFLAAFLPTVLLSAALGVLIAYAVDFTLHGQLGLLARTLRSGRVADARSLATGRGWGGLIDLAREVQEVLARAEHLAHDSGELKALQAAADDVVEKVRDWAETEVPPALEAEGALAEVVSVLHLLSDHLEDRAREAREVSELARESLGDAGEAIRQAGQESERAGREIATLLTALGEVRRLSGDLVEGSRKWSEESVAAVASAPHAAAAAAEISGAIGTLLGESELAAERWSAAAGRLRSVAEQAGLVERLALRAALETAALGLARGRGSPDWRTAVDEHRRTMAEAGRARAALGALEAEIAEVVERRRAELVEAGARARAAVAVAAAAPAPAPARLPAQVVSLAERLHQWARDGIARAERLAAMTERAASLTEKALAAARDSAVELGGLTARFETGAEARGEAPAATLPEPKPPPAPPAAGAERVADEAAEAAADASARVARSGGSRPLRLLTREDVLPEEEGDAR